MTKDLDNVVIDDVFDEDTEEFMDEKPSIKEKAAGVFNKVKNSKVAKVVGAVGLVAVGAVGAMALSGRYSDDSVCITADDDGIYITPNESGPSEE